MTKTNLLTVFVVTFVVAMLGVASVTPVFAVPVLNPANGHHYELISTILSWTDAKSAAEASVFEGVNGHLVTITSASENAFVEGLVPNNSIVWIGFTDEVNEGTFLWVTGEPVIYTNWNAGEPNDSGPGEDYAEFLADPPFSGSPWNDVQNVRSGNTGYVVEYEPTHSSMFDLLEEIQDELKDIWDAIRDEIIPLLEGIDDKLDNFEVDVPSAKVSETISFHDNYKLDKGTVLVLLDTTGSGKLAVVHVAANLSCNGDGDPTDGADTPDVSIVAGVAGVSVTAIPLVDTGFVGPDKTCVFHGTISAGDTPDGITDVIVSNSGPDDVAMDNSKITITGTYE